MTSADNQDASERVSEERLRVVHEMALDMGKLAGWEYDVASEKIRWSASPEWVLGYEPGTPGFVMDAGTDRNGASQPAEPEDLGAALVRPVLLAVGAEVPGGRYDLHHTVQGPEGEFHEVVVRASHLPGPDGLICVGVVGEVTSSWEVEQALRDMIDRYRLIVEHSPDGIVIHQDGRIVYGNKSALDLFKLSSRNEGRGRPIAEFLHEDFLTETLARIAELRHPGAASQPSEVAIVAADGCIVDVEARSVLTTWEGKPAYQVILHDISERRRAESALRYQASLVSHVSDAIIGVDGDGRIESWNPAAHRIYGWAPLEAIGQSVTRVLTGGHEHGALPVDGDRVHMRKGGEPIEVRVSVSPLLGERKEPSGWVVVCADVTEARRAETARRAAEERYTAVVAALEEGIVVVDGQGTLRADNQAAQRLLGHRLVGHRGDDLFTGGHPAIREDGLALPPGDCPIAATLRTGRAQTNVVMGVLDRGGQRQWLSVSSRLLTGSTRADDHAVVCSFSDISDRKKAEAKLSWQATHDHLTHLTNRAFFVTTLQGALADAHRQRSGMAVLFIDLDRFKLVNDSLGHGAGDEVLVAIGRRLEGAVRSGDVVSRLAGDEFAVLCREVKSVEAAVQLADALARILTQPITLLSKREVVATASIGVAYVEDGAREAQELLQDADVAMFRAKENGRARIEVFDEGLRKRARKRLEIHEDLRSAIGRGELTVHYQPMAAVGAGHPVGVEALVRWQHPSRGMLPPAEFIPLAEETELIVSLGSWVLRQACATVAGWRTRLPGAEEATVSVNVSARQLADGNLTTLIREVLESTGLSPRALVLEITESTLMADTAAASAVCRAIHDMGVRLAIDDFGTGYSSLAQLRSFPVDYLKIDQSFVSGLAKDPDDQAIVAAVVELGHTLGLEVVAEGVETPTQLEEVRRLGCDLYQGYLLARPMPAAQVSFAAGPETGEISA